MTVYMQGYYFQANRKRIGWVKFQPATEGYQMEITKKSLFLIFLYMSTGKNAVKE
jgi:hypothetical protein